MASRCSVREVFVVSSITGEVTLRDIVLEGGLIVGLRPANSSSEGLIIEGRKRYAVPGYIDPHLHIESSFVSPSEFVAGVVSHGTTSFAPDAHEVANVLGVVGLRHFMQAITDTPVTLRWMIPSSVPSVDGMETTGGRLDPEDIALLLREPDVGGLGEVMDAYGLAQGNPRTAEILKAGRTSGLLLEGHAPDITLQGLEELLKAGVDSDHSKSQVPLLLEKLRLGMFLEFQAKTLSKPLVSALRTLPLWPSFALCTDDVSADVLVDEGHLDRVGRIAVAAGLTVAEALRAMTWEPARRLRLWDRGVIAPGRRADILLINKLEEFTPSLVICGGEIVAVDGEVTNLRTKPSRPWDSAFYNTVRIPPVNESDFQWKADVETDGFIQLTGIAVNSYDNYTVPQPVVAQVRNSRIILPPHAALLMIMERYSGEGGRSYAPVVGMPWKLGAVASTYSHDAHNLTVLGTSPKDMKVATEWVMSAGGGIAVAMNGSVVASLALPIAGLLSDNSLDAVAHSARLLRQALMVWGYRHQNPFMNFSTLSLLVSPEIRLSDRGLFDVRKRRWWDEESPAHGPGPTPMLV